MKLLVDTNVILDYFEGRAGDEVAIELFKLAEGNSQEETESKKRPQLRSLNFRERILQAMLLNEANLTNYIVSCTSTV